MSPYFVCDRIKECITTSTYYTPTYESDSITNQISDATSVIKKCQRKFTLKMTHKARCTNQKYATDGIH